MGIRRLLASGVAIGLLLTAALPVAASDPNAYVVTTLVTGPSPDVDLVNAWGLSRGPTTPWWVTDNHTDVSTVYRADGSKLAAPRVAIPGGAPTGTVFNPRATAGDFNGDPFLFASEAGVITGWRGTLGSTAEVGNDHFAGVADFRGLAIGTANLGDGPHQYIYATDFHNGRVVVFDRKFVARTWHGAFVDPELPKGYAPFGIQTLKGMVFVAYAKVDPVSGDELVGAGLGIVDSYATDGTFLGRVASRGVLNAPWGLAWAPRDFGRFSNDLIVGNFGDGKLHAFSWDDHWHLAGTLTNANDRPITVDGLWAIAFGGGDLVNNGRANTLFFAAGPIDETAGAFGTIAAR